MAIDPNLPMMDPMMGMVPNAAPGMGMPPQTPLPPPSMSPGMGVDPSLAMVRRLTVDQSEVRRKRVRKDSFKFDKTAIAERISTFYDNDTQERQGEIDARLQRYAKYRMWTEGKDWPWEDCSDVGLPDLAQHSLRTQDTLHNAVMSIRPAIATKATNKANRDKQETVDNLLDYQMFEEQPGEHDIGTLIENFVNDGEFTCYVPWVRERREVHDVRIIQPIPYQSLPMDYFREHLEGMFQGSTFVPSGDGWDWKIVSPEGDEITVKFYTREDGDVEIDIERDAMVFDGPRMIPKGVQDVLHPARCENLQMPGPSNPLGASHVILRDFPHLDEIKRLCASGYYDLVSDEEKKVMGVTARDTDNQELEEQKDRMQGIIEQQRGEPDGVLSHKRLTRLMCFDCYDVDGDGLDEDVIWWMILETKTVLRARLLTQMFPAVPPRRPFAEAQFIPVPGRRLGIGILEMMEGLHDVKKQIMDQTVDNGTLSNVPFFFYKPTSNMRPETIRLWPGEGYPLTSPGDDVNFPQLPTQGQAFGINMMTMLTQEQERLTTTGDLQFGRVPQGKASALRTVSGMQTVLSQGDARPQRVLRRFFIGLSQIAHQFHDMNRCYLPKQKEFRIVGYVKPEDDPYKRIGDRSEIEGDFSFTFMANALNTNKEALQQSLGTLIGMFVSQLNVQLGILKPDGLFRIQYDYAKAFGIDAERYLSAPQPGAFEPNILAEEAINLIMSDQLPKGAPAEGAQEHMKRMMQFVNSDQFGYLSPGQVDLMKQYLNGLSQKIQQETQQQALLQATAQMQGQGGAPGGAQAQAGGPSAAEIQKFPPIGDNELLDETMPSAGGGGNVGTMGVGMPGA